LLLALIHQNLIFALVLTLNSVFLHTRIITIINLFLFSLLPYFEFHTVTFLVLLSLSTFIAMTSISGTLAICYAVFSTILILSQAILGNLEYVLFVFLLLNLTVFSLAYLRSTLFSFESLSIILILIIQKTFLVVSIFCHLSRFTPLQSIFVLGISTFFLLQTFSRILIVVISSIQVIFVGNSFLEISESAILFFVLYTSQILFLVSENYSSVLFSIF
jgi:hypothetical protein